VANLDTEYAYLTPLSRLILEQPNIPQMNCMWFFVYEKIVPNEYATYGALRLLFSACVASARSSRVVTTVSIY
jgi:hypothetical protein